MRKHTAAAPTAGQLALDWGEPEPEPEPSAAVEAVEVAAPAPAILPEEDERNHAPPVTVPAPEGAAYTLATDDLPPVLPGEELKDWCERTRVPPPGYLVRPWGLRGDVNPVQLCDPSRLTGAYRVLPDERYDRCAKVCTSEAAAVYWLWVRVLSESLNYLAACLVNMPRSPLPKRRGRRSSTSKAASPSSR